MTLVKAAGGNMPPAEIVLITYPNDLQYITYTLLFYQTKDYMRRNFCCPACPEHALTLRRNVGLKVNFNYIFHFISILFFVIRTFDISTSATA